MTISASVHERMAEYTVSQGENKVSILQFRDARNMWGQPVVSSVIYLRCGGDSGVDPAEMSTELYVLYLEIQDVLRALDKRMKEMGDKYHPPIYPILPGR